MLSRKRRERVIVSRASTNHRDALVGPMFGLYDVD